MLTSALLALLLVGASLAAGHAMLALLGARRATWLSGAVGFAALTVVAALAIRLPGRAATAAIVAVVAVAAGIFATRGSLRRGPGLGPGLCVIAVVLIVSMVPFFLEGRAGTLGEGIYTNDHAAQLYWTDWLQNGLGPEPSAVAWGYPVGPQSLVAAVAEGTGASLVDAFSGLLLAIPVLTALAALTVLGALRPLPRVATAALAGIPFLGASFLAQSAFKETAMAMLVLAFAATLALATEVDGEERPALGARAAAGAAVLIALAAVFVYSVPGLVWLALTLGGWLVLGLVTGERTVDWGAVRDIARRRRVPLLVAGALLIAIAALTLGRISEFTDRIGDVQASAGRLSSPVWPGEALGIWPEGDFRVVRGDVAGSLLVTAAAGLLLVAGAIVMLRRGAYALLAALGAAFVVYVGARAFASIYVEAKALAVMAPLVIVVALGGLLAAPGNWRRVLGALGVAFAIAAGVSTLLALREAPVGFPDRGEELEALAERTAGETVAFLGVDRFGAYWLRGSLVESPGGYVPPEVRARPEKVWQQGHAMDFDTLPSRRLDDFRFAITTAGAYQSTPPPNWKEVERTVSYVLWEREGKTPRAQVLEEREAPGKVLGEAPCRSRGPEPRFDLATTFPRPVVGDPRDWSLPTPFEAPATATQALELGRGTWQLSVQYHSQVDLTLSAEGASAELPASLVGMYLTRQGQSAFWPAGAIEVGSRGRVEVTVEAAEPDPLERATGAPRRVWLGEVAATRIDPLRDAPPELPLLEACGAYVDHIGASGAR